MTLRHTPEWSRHLPSGLAPGDVDLLRDRSLPRSWVRNWQADPGRPVLHTLGGGWRSAGDLESASARAAGRLHAAGLTPGDRVVVSAASCAALVDAHVGALRLGLVIVPANTAYTGPEVAHLIADARPALAIVDDEDRAAGIRSATADLRVVSPGLELPDGPIPALDSSSPEDPALIGYTSGTTGKPKGAVLSHGNLLAGAEALRLAWRWSAQDRLALALPLFHMHGLGVGLHGTFHAGASAVLIPQFHVDTVLDAISRHACTLFFGVPTMYRRLVGSPRLDELGSLRLLVSGSAPLPPDLFKAIDDGCGHRVVERYGMTETLMIASNPCDGDRRAGTVGIPLPGVDVRLAHSSSGTREGTAAGTGTPGAPAEIEVRGPNVFRGYWRRPDATAEAFTPDGWFRTGDLGTTDAGGYLRIVGRSKDLIISGGLNVHPREVEEVLRLHPAIGDAAVVGRPSVEWGEEVVAYLEADDTEAARPGENAIVAFLAEHLAAYKRPKRITWLASLPRNALGKVTRHELPY